MANYSAKVVLNGVEFPYNPNPNYTMMAMTAGCAAGLTERIAQHFGWDTVAIGTMGRSQTTTCPEPDVFVTRGPIRVTQGIVNGNHSNFVGTQEIVGEWEGVADYREGA